MTCYQLTLGIYVYIGPCSESTPLLILQFCWVMCQVEVVFRIHHGD